MGGEGEVRMRVWGVRLGLGTDLLKPRQKVSLLARLARGPELSSPIQLGPG